MKKTTSQRILLPSRLLLSVLLLASISIEWTWARQILFVNDPYDDVEGAQGAAGIGINDEVGDDAAE